MEIKPSHQYRDWRVSAGVIACSCALLRQTGAVTYGDKYVRGTAV